MATLHIRVPAEDRRQQIIEAAGDLFAARGYEGTTTRELAEKIGINEAILFRHFPTKEDLYWAVLEHMIGMHETKDRLRKHMVSGLPDREVLIAVAEDILNRSVQLTRLLFYSILERHELSERFFKTHVIAYHEILADYIRRTMRAGRFREMDPILAARAFIGMFSYHFQIQELFGGKQVHQFQSHEVISNLVDIWLEGMCLCLSPNENKRANSRRNRRVVIEKAAR
jgi:AcrR family transcriptional regulator